MKDTLIWEDLAAPAEADAPPHPIVILFCDDSTLFFALRMRDVLAQTATPPPVELAWYVDESSLSYRQMAQLLPQGPDRALRRKGLEQLMAAPDVAAIITSRVFRPMQRPLNDQLTRLRAGRPCVIAFLGGLDFFPESGFSQRRNCDSVFLFPAPAISTFNASGPKADKGWQLVGFGHPSFLRPVAKPRNLSSRRDIYFFTQALSPSTKRGRLHMLRALAALAQRHPDRTVWIKLRHLPHENQKHLHPEKYDYPGLLAQLPDAPANLKLTACTMDEALADAALGITCTSTAAIDLLREGVPAMVYLEYVDTYRDALVAPMRKLFAGSNLITSLEDMINLRIPKANQGWLESMLCPRDLGKKVIDTIDAFEARPFQLREAPVG